MSMEEEHLRELEAIANSLPADPFGMGRLRLLLGSLPSPTQPEVKSAREGLPDQAPGGSGIGQALSLTSGLPIGSESGAVIGAVPELFYGQTNLLENPALNGILTGVSVNVNNTEFPIAPHWDAFYVLNSGTISEVLQDGQYPRGGGSNPMASAWSDVSFKDNAGDDYNIDFYIQPSVAPNNLFGAPATAHLVAACRVWHSIASLNTTNFPAFFATMQIVDYDLGTVIAESTPFDLRTLTDHTTKISCSVEMADVITSNDIRWRLHIHCEKLVGVTTPDPFFTWGEPSLSQSATQSPPPYTPQLGRWFPDYLEQWSGGDTAPRLTVGSTAGEADIRYGPGNASQDIRIRRTGTKELTIDDVLGGAAKLIVGALRVGAASKLIQTGTGDLVFSAAATASEAVNFPVQFDNTPVVICWRTDGTGGSPKIHIWASGPSTTSFTANGATGDGTTSSATRNYAWLALDPTLLA